MGLHPPPTEADVAWMERAVELALATEAAGNLAIGSLIVLDGKVLAEGPNRMLTEGYHPGRHAEMTALAAVPLEAWPRAQHMTCYTTLEPCAMCFGSLLLHGVGRVVFGATDKPGGAGCLIPHLPEFYQTGGRVPEWIGPIASDVCDPLFVRTLKRFDRLPIGRTPVGDTPQED